MTCRVVTAGRTDIDDFFRLSGIHEHKKLNHTPLLVFVAAEDAVEVRILERADHLLAYPDDTRVMAQWRGQWRSDFFQFSVGQFREFISRNPAEPWHVV